MSASLEVTRFDVEPTYRKENGVLVLDIEAVDVPFEVVDRSVISIPAQESAGNHSHPREEGFVCLSGEAEIHWEKPDGTVEMLKMRPDGRLSLSLIPPNVPHVIINRSGTEAAVLLELADAYQTFEDVTRSSLLDTTK